MNKKDLEIISRIAEATREADTASSLAESLKTLDNTDIEQGKEFINIICNERGIDSTAQELAKINLLCKEAQQQAADAKINNTLADIIDKAQKTLEQFEDGVSPTDPKNKDAITEAFKTINKHAAALFSNTSTIDREATWESILQAWEKDKEVDFAPDIFDKLAFPNSTVSYIGARTGRGKTTAMVNIGIEALFPTDEKTKPRRVLFVSLEESIKQIARRFALCLAYRNANNTHRGDLLKVTNPYTDKEDPKNAYKNFMHDVPNGGKGAKTFVDCITNANKTLAELLKEGGNLAIFDGIGASFAEIMARIRQCGRGDVVVFDYIQKIPANGEIHGGNPDLERIRIGSQELTNAAAITESVIIAGAQLNRESQGGSGNKKNDTFTDADFRGCGDLEQDAHNAIGIGRTADKETTYYGIIKTREDALTDRHCDLDFRGGYSYMGHIADGEKSKSEKDKETKEAGEKTESGIDDGRGGWPR
jgi:hypothetical protein